MAHPSSDIAFTPSVKAVQTAQGSREAYELSVVTTFGTLRGLD